MKVLYLLTALLVNGEEVSYNVSLIDGKPLYGQGRCVVEASYVMELYADEVVSARCEKSGVGV